MQAGYVYILASRRHGTFYVGITSDPVRRIREHKDAATAGFTKRYGVHRLVYIERHPTIMGAIRREKQIKWWRRQWKIELIETPNPGWRDLYEELIGQRQSTAAAARPRRCMDPGSGPG